MNLILFGYKKCGKTYFGLKVAHKMHMQYLDTDQMIEDLFTARYHQTLPCKQIVIHHGLHLLRELEKQVIYSLSHVKNTVIALGGGAVLDESNVEYIQKIGTLVYLKTDKETLKKRILSGEIPSYIDAKDPVRSFEDMHANRKPFYEKIPAFTIDTALKSEEDVVMLLSDIVEKIKDSEGESSI
jgi:shikimate kinase